MASNSRILFCDILFCDITVSLALLGLCLVLTRQMVEAGADRYCPSDYYNQPKRGICGRNLANLVTTVCRPLGGIGKRDIDYLDEVLFSDDVVQSNSDSDVEKLIGGAQSGSVFLPKSLALSYLRSQRSISDDSGLEKRSSHIQRRGIVCECCVHQCNLGELRMYCERPHDAQDKKRSAHRQSSSNVLIPSSSSVMGTDEQQRPMPSSFHRFGSPLSATYFKSNDNGGFDDADRD